MAYLDQIPDMSDHEGGGFRLYSKYTGILSCLVAAQEGSGKRVER